jgi:hypothetical protein
VAGGGMLLKRAAPVSRKGRAITMTQMQSEVFEAFRSIDVPEDKALKAAAALSKRDDDVTSVRSELTVIKWMMGFVLAFQVAIFVKLFLR